MMFQKQASGDQMDVTSPVKPQPPQQVTKTLPAFLLGRDIESTKSVQMDQNQPVFNNTPTKNRLDQENRPPLIFSRKFNQASNKNSNSKPFQNNNSNPSRKQQSGGPPVSSLGEVFGMREQNFKIFDHQNPFREPASAGGNNFFQETTAQPIQTPSGKPIMMSSPLPEKTGACPRIQTPEFVKDPLDLSCSPIVSTQQQQPQTSTTPLARQMFEKQLHKQNIQKVSEEQPSNLSFNPEDEIECWVSIFGFNSRNIDLIMRRLVTCGSVVSRQPAKREQANWMHLRFASRNQAKRAKSRFNSQILEGTNILLGVVECVEPNYILEYTKGGNAFMNQSVVQSTMDVSMNQSNIGMRSLCEPTQTRSNADPFNVPQRENNGMVRRTLGYFLPNMF